MQTKAGYKLASFQCGDSDYFWYSVERGNRNPCMIPETDIYCIYDKSFLSYLHSKYDTPPPLQSELADLGEIIYYK